MQRGTSKTFLLPLIVVILLSVSAGAVPRRRKVKAKVLILGAGAAGLAAAKTLSENGITDFIILEGSDRIGGRVKSVPFGGKTVEAGANWIVGRKNNPLFDIAKDLNIQGKVSNYDSVVIRNSDGIDVTDTEGEEAWSKFERALKKFPDIIDRLEDGKFDMSIRSCLDVGKWRPKTPVEKVVEIYDFDFEYAHIPGVSSCLAADRVSQFVDEAFYVQDEMGYEFILKKYAEDVVTSNDPRLYLNEIIKRIQYNGLKVKVITQTKKTFEADYAIMTFSLGVLKSDSVTFKPKLPDWKIDSISRVRYEGYLGIYLKFPDSMSRFWDDTEFILYADERRGFYPTWQNLEADGLYPRGTNILEVVTFGEEATRISLLSDSMITAEVMEMLRRVYNHSEIPDPVDVFIPNWLTDPLYLGSFSNVEPGAANPEVFVNLTCPVGRLYFAGEAYDRVFSGYVFGALRSGVKSAMDVLKVIKDSSEDDTIILNDTMKPQSSHIMENF